MRIKAKNNSELWNKLEQLHLEWRRMNSSYDIDSAQMSLNLEITETFFALFPDQGVWETFGEFWMSDIDKYDPEKGNFQSYLLTRLKFREQDMRHKDQGERREVYEEDGRKYRRWVQNISLDAPIDEEGSETLEDTLADTSGLNGQELLEAEERIRELISLILVLPERLNGQARNQTRINYFRMFFTDSMVDILHTEGEMIRISHERDLFDAMNLSFLDFFMEAPCRTAREIIRTNLKLYGQMVKGRPMNTPEQPLPNDVYMQYMQEVEGTKLKSASAITNQRMAYRAFLEENLC